MNSTRGAHDALVAFGQELVVLLGSAKQAYELLDGMGVAVRNNRRKGRGWLDGIAASLHNLGRAAQSQGDYATARVLHEESLAIRRELGDKSGIAYALSDLGLVAIEQADYGAAGFLYAQSLAIRQDVGDKWGMAACLTGLAGVAEAREQSEHAARLLGATEALLEAIGGRLDALERVVSARTVAAVQTALGETACAAAWAEGRAMTLEDAVACALKGPHTAGSPLAIASPVVNYSLELGHSHFW